MSSSETRPTGTTDGIPTCAAPREPTRPAVPLPPNACDTHAHVFGPASRFPYGADRSYTPPDAPLGTYLRMLDTLGLLDLFQLWTPDTAVRHRIVVDYPARLYGLSD